MAEGMRRNDGLTLLTRRRWGGGSGTPETKQVRHDPVGAVGSGWQLAPEPEADVDPASLSNLRFDQGAALVALVVVERFVQLNQIRIPGIPAVGVEEVETALLHPTGPVGSPEYGT